MALLLSGSAILTGAASGLGRHTAYCLLKHGVKRLALFGAPSALPALTTTAEELKRWHTYGTDVRAHEVDVSRPETIEKAVEQVVKDFGTIDVAVNNIGLIGPGGLMLEVEGLKFFMGEEIRWMLKQEHRGPRHPRGSIVNMIPVLGVLGSVSGQAEQTTVTDAILGMTKRGAMEYARRGIRINSISPGYVEGCTEEGLLHLEEEHPKGVEESIPVGRTAELEEVSDAIVFLASQMSSYITGTHLAVDGGLSAKE